MTTDTAWLMGGGFLLLVLGGEALVRGASSAAKALGVSPLLIGLTLLAWGAYVAVRRPMQFKTPPAAGTTQPETP